MSKMKCAVIGCGAIGTGHAERYARSPRAELVADVDILPERAQALAARHHVPLAIGVMIDWGVHFIDLILYCLSGPELLTVSGVAHARLGESLREYAYLDMFQAEIDAFLDSAASGEPCMADIDAVLPTQRVLDGFYRSARLGREVRL